MTREAKAAATYEAMSPEEFWRVLEQASDRPGLSPEIKALLFEASVRLYPEEGIS